MSADTVRRHNGVFVAVLCTFFLLSQAACTSRAAPAQHVPAAPATSLDGAVYGQPLVVGDVVFAATENDTVYAVSATDGSITWRAHLAEPENGGKLPCSNIDLVGITSRPVYDPAAHRLYVVGETSGAHHILFGLDASSGAVTARVPVDPPIGTPDSYLQRPALALLDGHVYAAFGGNFGDCGTYTGAVASIDVAHDDSVAWYEASTDGRGGIWAPGAPVLANGRLYYSVGNGWAENSSSPYDNTDSVVALTPDLKRADFFAPTKWAEDNANDNDLGSMNPALVNGHIVIAGKAGIGYVLDAAHLGGIGGQPAFDNCRAFGAAAVDGDIAYLPCAYGTMAVRIASDGTASVLWHTAVPANGTPVLANGKLWVTDWNAGTLYALDPATGRALSQAATGPLPHFATPAIAGARLFLGTTGGIETFAAQ
jgi:polyvinyl alcohol dehydrogenase (cytochrome)